MGHIVHHAIVVTSWCDKSIEAAAKFARDEGMQVLGPSEPLKNGYRTIVVCPDGSKSGWEDSAKGDARRDMFIAWIRTKAYDDGSSSYEWVEAQYGSDDREASVSRSQWSAPDAT